MMKNSIMHRRNIACFVALIVVICSVLTPFMGVDLYSVLGDAVFDVVTNNYNKDNATENSVINNGLKTSDNLLYNKEFSSVVQYNGEKFIYDAFPKGTSPKIYTDGDIITNSQINNKFYFNDDGTPKNIDPYTNPQCYTDLTYSFEDNANVEEIRLYHHHNNELVNYVYQIYLSDSEETLYSAESLVLTHENTAKNNYQIFKFSEAIQNKKYFGIRFLVPTPTNTPVGAMIRLGEVAVIGELAPVSPINVVSENFTSSNNVSYELASPGNLLYGRTYEDVYQNNNGADNSAAAENTIKANPGVLTDGKTGTSTFFSGRIYYNEETGEPNQVAPFENCNYYTDLTYSFAAKSDVYEIWIYNHTSEALINYAYEVYLSADKETLYDDASLVTLYVNEGLKSMQKIKLREPKKDMLYVGIRFLMPTKEFQKDSGSVVRLSELAVMGTATLPETTVTTGTHQSTDTVAELKSKSNILYGKEVSAFQNNDGATNKTSVSSDFNPLFTDGELSTIGQANTAIYYKNDSTPYNVAPYLTPKHYTDFTYNLEGVAKVSEIWVYSHQNPQLATQAYQLFLSDSEEGLFTAASLVATYENADGSTNQKFVFAEELKNKRYFGIRFLNPVPVDSVHTGGSRYVRAAELAVMGEVKDEPFRVYSDDYTTKEEDPELKAENNLLLNKEYNQIIQFNNGDYSGSVGAETDLKENPTAITDGGTDDSVRLLNQIYYKPDGTPKNIEPYTDSKYYTTLTYFLGGSSTVNEVWIYHHNNPELTTKVYQIYMSDSRDTLYDDTSLIATYVNENNKNRQKFVFTEALTGKQYVGIKFLVSAPVTDSYQVGSLYLRIAQLAVFGTVDTPAVEDTTVVDPENELYETLYEKYTRNLIRGKIAKIWSYNGEEETQIKPKNRNSLTDEKNTGGFYSEDPLFAEYVSADNVDYYTDGEDRYLKLEYDMGTSCDIGALLLVNHSNELYRTYSYEVYLSETKETLWDAGSQIEDYVNADLVHKQLFEYSEAKQGQYIGIKIKYPTSKDVKVTAEENNIYTRLNEIAVFGNYTDPDYVEPLTVYSDNYVKKAEESELKTSKNLLLGKKHNQLIQYNKGDYSGAISAAEDLENEKTATTITDGGTNDSIRILNQIYYNSDGTPKNIAPYENPKSYTALTYFLGGSATINEVWIYHHDNPELATKTYQIYMSDSRDTLYEKESLITTFENEDDNTRQKFIFPKTLTGKQYIGIKFLVSAPVTDKYPVNSLYVRIAQLAVFGTIDEVTKEDKRVIDYDQEFYDSLYEKYDKNLIKGKIAQIFSYDGLKESQISPEKVSSLTDESNANAFFTGHPRFGEYVSADKIYYYEDGTERYLKLQYNMGTLCDVSAVLLVHHSGEKYRTYSYEIYLSETKETLWDEKSKIEDYVNSDLAYKDLFEYKEAKKGKYIGIKVKYPTSKEIVITKDENTVYTRLSEIAVFGNYSDPNYVEPPSYAIGEITDEGLKKLGTNLLSNIRPTIRFNGTPMSKSHYGDKELQFTDGIMSPHVDVTSPSSGTGKLITTDGSDRLDIIYDFNDVKYDFTSFLFAGISNVAATQYFTGWYQVYIAEDYDDLFVPESMVFEYNWEEEFFERGHYVPFSKAKRGCYFAIRILNPVSGAEEYIAPRISEIAAYGGKANVIVKPTNLASNMPIETYTENKKGVLKKISESNLTVAEVKNMTDASPTTSATIKTKNKVQLVYNLCNDAVIDEFKLTSNAKKYKVYASDNLDEIWTENALVYTYNGSETNGLKLTKGISVRYVRFEISKFGKLLKISDLQCIGGDDQLLKHKKLSRSYEGKQVSVYMYNLDEKKQEYAKESINGSLSKLFDSGYLAPVGIYGGSHGKVALDVILKLDDIRNIDNLAISFPKLLPGYSPTKFEVYTSEIVDAFDFGEFTEEPTAEYDGKPVLGTYSVSFRPRLARSILVRLIAGDETYDPYYNGEMVFGVTELEIEGTPVKGMQKDKEKKELVTFSDDESGVKVDILKFDNNDIYTRVHSISVKEVPATHAQKQSLASQGALKIMNNTVYEIKLLDIFGKEIKNADGRDIRISMPCDIEKYGYPVVAKVTEDEVSAVEAISEDGYTSVTVDDLADARYLVSVYADPDDPYFENLEVYIPEEDATVDLPDEENGSLNDGTPILPEEMDEFYDDFDDADQNGTSPETGEDLPVMAVVLFVSAVGLFVVSRKKLI